MSGPRPFATDALLAAVVGTVLVLAPAAVQLSAQTAAAGLAGLVLVGLTARWRLPLADVLVVAVAGAGSAAEVLGGAPYAPAGAVAVGTLGYAYLALVDLARPDGRSRAVRRPAVLGVGRTAGIGGVLGLGLLAAGGGPPVAGGPTLAGLVALVAAALLAWQGGT